MVYDTTLFSKLKLCMIKHNRPYKLQLVNDCDDVKVTK